MQGEHKHLCCKIWLSGVRSTLPSNQSSIPALGSSSRPRCRYFGRCLACQDTVPYYFSGYLLFTVILKKEKKKGEPSKYMSLGVVRARQLQLPSHIVAYI